VSVDEQRGWELKLTRKERVQVTQVATRLMRFQTEFVSSYFKQEIFSVQVNSYESRSIVYNAYNWYNLVNKFLNQD